MYLVVILADQAIEALPNVGLLLIAEAPVCMQGCNMVHRCVQLTDMRFEFGCAQLEAMHSEAAAACKDCIESANKRKSTWHP
jgi:hypothetical protein